MVGPINGPDSLISCCEVKPSDKSFRERGGGEFGGRLPFVEDLSRDRRPGLAVMIVLAGSISVKFNGLARVHPAHDTDGRVDIKFWKFG